MRLEDEDNSRGGRALLIAYHYPPSLAAGALRWASLVRLAGDRGWDFDVVTRQADRPEVALPPGEVVRVVEKASRLEALEGAASAAAKSLRGMARRGSSSGPPGDVPAGAAPKERVTSLHRTELLQGSPSRRLLRSYYALRTFRGFRAWAMAAGRAGRELARDRSYDVVLSSGPPHAIHLGARSLARSIGCPYVLDFRDPWFFYERLPEHLASPTWYRLAERHEPICVGEAAATILNTDRSRAALEDQYPDLAERFVTITNGCDLPDEAPHAPSDAFVIAYGGEIYLDRDPRPLMKAAARIIRRRNLGPDEFRLEFMGRVQAYQGVPLMDTARDLGIENHLVLHESRPRQELARFLAGASVLVSLPQDSHRAIPSKIYEYMAFPAWMLVMAIPASATAELLQGVEADVVLPGDVDAIERVLEQRFDQWSRGERAEPLGTIPRFQRASQADQLVELLDRVKGGGQASPRQPADLTYLASGRS
jgi:hypothetical protein